MKQATEEKRQVLWEMLLLASARGRKRVDRHTLRRRVAEVPIADRKNQQTLQLATNTSCYLIQQLIKEGYLRRALKRTKSLLTVMHKEARMKFNEKRFYIKKIGQKVYILTGKDDVPTEEPPVQGVRKQRASVNRPAGVVEKKPASMTRELSRKMLLEYVIPAIKAKWPHAQMLHPIKIQQDNARPHVDVNDPVVVAAGTSGGWNIRLANQPAQSPELNALDVGFFTAFNPCSLKQYHGTSSS
ncbi:hypothetical protein F442_17857 [Phytophthora nicotianae P10297]|uniref:Transposase Tc1-like domain-containing protein n=1 Tax=Phytophthora nicotianae P10297 TaxID=1317064 RepID=W2YF59_PHYNI|nr:hypothetical protein F442_17857 [Phytophthora nicotianae P10297]